MGYNVETMPQADEELGRLPRPIRNVAIRRFLDFAQNPGIGGSKSAPSIYGLGQLFEMHLPYDQMTCWIGIVFRYGSDEQTLIIERVYVEFV